MPNRFEILKSRGIVYIRHWGLITAAESNVVMSEYMQHPDSAPGQMHLVDLTDVTEIEMDYAKLMALQAKMADKVNAGPHKTLLVLLATRPDTLAVARSVKNSWEGSGVVIPNVVETEAQALAILGQSETRISQLLDAVSAQGR